MKTNTKSVCRMEKSVARQLSKRQIKKLNDMRASYELKVSLAGVLMPASEVAESFGMKVPKLCGEQYADLLSEKITRVLLKAGFKRVEIFKIRVK